MSPEETFVIGPDTVAAYRPYKEIDEKIKIRLGDPTYVECQTCGTHKIVQRVEWELFGVSSSAVERFPDLPAELTEILGK